MSEEKISTPAQLKMHKACKKKIQKIFDKYQAQGLITYLKGRKTCFSTGWASYYKRIYFEAKAFTGQRSTNFGFTFTMEDGITYYQGVMKILLEPDSDKYINTIYQRFKDKEKWTPIMRSFAEEVKRETALERFLWRKEEGLN